MGKGLGRRPCPLPRIFLDFWCENDVIWCICGNILMDLSRLLGGHVPLPLWLRQCFNRQHYEIYDCLEDSGRLLKLPLSLYMHNNIWQFLQF